MATGTTTRRRVDIPLKSDEACCVVVSLPNTEQIAKQAKLLSALADTTRLSIIKMLSGLDVPLCVCDITSQFSLGQPTISHHLKVLRDAGLVTWDKQGLWVYYALNDETMGEISGYLQSLVGETKGVIAAR